MKKIILYTLSTCPWCRKAKKFFKDRNVPCEIIDYDLAPDAEQERIRDEIKRFGERPSFPAVIIGDEIVVGYNPERYAELLGLK